MNDPIANPYSPPFQAFCCRCGRIGSSGSLAAGPEPFLYIGWECQDAETRERVRLAADAAFHNLSERERHGMRVRLFGTSRTREIEARTLGLA